MTLLCLWDFIRAASRFVDIRLTTTVSYEGSPLGGCLHELLVCNK